MLALLLKLYCFSGSLYALFVVEVSPHLISLEADSPYNCDKFFLFI